MNRFLDWIGSAPLWQLIPFWFAVSAVGYTIGYFIGGLI